MCGQGSALNRRRPEPSRLSMNTAIFPSVGGISPDRPGIECFIMKNNYRIALIFILGLLCGSLFNWFFRGGPVTNAPLAPAAGVEASSPETGGPEPPAGTILSERFLPNTAPYWVLADLKRWRQHTEGFSDLFEQETVATVWNQFTASLPQGATPALAEVFQNAEEMRLFLLPPLNESAPLAAVAAFAIPHATAPGAPGAVPPGIHSLMASYPEAATRVILDGSQAIQVVESPLGTWGWRVDDGWLWISNQPDSLAHLWSTPPPPESIESPGPQAAIWEQYPNTVTALFINARYPGAPIPGVLGGLTQIMRENGTGQAYCLVRFPENRGVLTVMAQTESATPWVSDWKPLPEFPFKEADPAGLIEIALRWPTWDSPFAATAALASVSPGFDALFAAGRPGDSTRTLSPGSREEDPAFLSGLASDNLPSRRRRDRPFRFRPREGDPVQMRTVLAQTQMRFLSELFPPGKEIGVNFFGFYDQSPALAIAIPSLDSSPLPQQRLQAMPFLEAEDIEVALLPGMLFRFRDTPFTRFLGLNELLVIERDAVTYLFDALEAARNYLGEKDLRAAARDTRSPAARGLLEHVRTPAQIEAVIHGDFYQYVLEQEKNRVPGDFPFKDDLNALLDDILNHTQPMAASAGWADPHWFLETYTESEAALLVNTGVMLLALYRFLGY